MKITKQFSIMMVGVLLSFSIISCKTPSHTITLHVDTGNIDQQNIDAYCNFGQASGLSNEDFTTYAEKGDKIIWGGVSSSSSGTDQVKIKKIKYKRGPKILNKLELTGEKSVVGKVKKGNIGDTVEYSIQFIVINNGVKRNGTFTIDPKIQVIRYE
jgi:hypothetical protein